MTKLFVWDLHGVLEEGNEEAVVYVTNKILSDFGFSKKLDMKTCVELYGKKWFEYFKHLLPEESLDTHVRLQEASFKLSDDNFDMVAGYLSPSRYSHEVLSEIRFTGNLQVLISNTRQASLARYMSALYLDDYFPEKFAYAVSAHDPGCSATKEDAFRDFLGKLDVSDIEKIVIIGDSPSDMKLKDVAGGVTYQYTHPWIPFRNCESDYKIHDLRELIKEL